MKILLLTLFVALTVPAQAQSVQFLNKILTESEYNQFMDSGVFEGSAHDKRDGFIHLATTAQLEGIIEKHFSKESTVYILELNIYSTDKNVVWEVASNGDLYPHLYNIPLRSEMVVKVIEGVYVGRE